jgi:glycosyltransferase involved in cell wall biosynthesis
MIKVVHLISSLSRGGRERQLATIYKYSDKEKVETTVVCFKQVNNSYIGEYQMEKDVIFLKAQSKPGRYKELKKYINAHDISIVWSWGVIEATLGILISLFSKAKHINGSVRHGIVLPNFRHSWRTIMLHLSRHIVANSRAGLMANKLKRGYVMYNGLDKQFSSSNESSSEEIRKMLSVREGMVCMLSIANLVPFKDYKTILLALQRIKHSGRLFHYFIIGEGPERSNIELLRNELGLENDVTLLGMQKDVKGMLQVADIFIHSSRGEGCSNAILEALAAGLPVIASNTGGTVEIVDATVGRLFEYRNIDELTLNITELIANAGLRTSLGINGKAKIAFSFSIERMMHDYYSILESVHNK